METPNYKLGGEIMTNRKQLTQELREAYKSIATPDFSAEDWIKLHKDANKGCSISAEMLIRLWNIRIEPYLSPEFKKWRETNAF